MHSSEHTVMEVITGMSEKIEVDMGMGMDMVMQMVMVMVMVMVMGMDMDMCMETMMVMVMESASLGTKLHCLHHKALNPRGSLHKRR